MNAEQKALARQLLSTAGPNQLKINNAVSTSVLELAKEASLRSLIPRGLAQELANEMIKRSVIERVETTENFGISFRAVVWAFTPEQIAEFALACYERGLKASEVAL